MRSEKSSMRTTATIYWPNNIDNFNISTTFHEYRNLLGIPPGDGKIDIVGYSYISGSLDWNVIEKLRESSEVQEKIDFMLEWKNKCKEYIKNQNIDMKRIRIKIDTDQMIWIRNSGNITLYGVHYMK